MAIVIQDIGLLNFEVLDFTLLTNELNGIKLEISKSSNLPLSTFVLPLCYGFNSQIKC